MPFVLTITFFTHRSSYCLKICAFKSITSRPYRSTPKTANRAQNQVWRHRYICTATRIHRHTWIHTHIYMASGIDIYTFICVISSIPATFNRASFYFQNFHVSFILSPEIRVQSHTQLFNLFEIAFIWSLCSFGRCSSSIFAQKKKHIYIYIFNYSFYDLLLACHLLILFKLVRFFVLIAFWFQANELN